MTEVTFQTMILDGNIMIPTTKTVTSKMNEKEIVSALETAGVRAFTGMNFESSTYQTMPGRVFVKLQTVTISERAISGIAV